MRGPSLRPAPGAADDSLDNRRAGVGFGAGFQGGIRLVAPLARTDQRAGVLSVLFTIA